MLRVALPNKGTLAEPASILMREAGYRQRSDSRDLSVLDESNEVEFFYLRPKDIATYVGKGNLDLGVTGHDLMDESGSPTHPVLRLGFGRSQFCFAAGVEHDWKLEDLDGKNIATSYPRLVRSHLAGRRISANIVKLDGAVEISIQLGLADAIADVVSSGRTLRQHNLRVIGDPIATSEATLVGREPRSDRQDDERRSQDKKIFTERLRGVVYARRYTMLDYDCPLERLDAAMEVTPGLQSPTVAPLSDESWRAVRAMVLTSRVNLVMDKLAQLGCKGILTSTIRSCRGMPEDDLEVPLSG